MVRPLAKEGQANFPSWSWAAVGRAFHMPHDSVQVLEEHGNFDFINGHTSSSHSSKNQYGFVRNPILQVRTNCMVCCAILPDMMRIILHVPNKISRDEISILSGCCFWDYDGYEDTLQHCLLLPIGTLRSNLDRLDECLAYC